VLNQCKESQVLLINSEPRSSLTLFKIVVELKNIYDTVVIYLFFFVLRCEIVLGAVSYTLSCGV